MIIAGPIKTEVRRERIEAFERQKRAGRLPEIWVDRSRKVARAHYLERALRYAGVWICQAWDIEEDGGVFRFMPRYQGGGLQVATTNFRQYSRFTVAEAALMAEAELKARCDEYAAQFKRSSNTWMIRFADDELVQL